jgi:hypothetical protein
VPEGCVSVERRNIHIGKPGPEISLKSNRFTNTKRPNEPKPTLLVNHRSGMLSAVMLATVTGSKNKVEGSVAAR